MKKKLARLLSVAISAAMLLSSIGATEVFAVEQVVQESQINTLSEINFTKQGGAIETAYAEWTPVEGTKLYEVQYRKSGETEWSKPIDTELIRQYPTYWRADALGLPAELDGTDYDLKVTAYDANKTVIATGEATKLSVRNADRQGFCFSPDSKYGKYGVGAYKLDGTLKDNAQVIYVTAGNAKTVTAQMYVEKNKPAQTVTGLQAILDSKQKGNDTNPLDIRILGLIEKDDLDYISSKAEGLQIKGKNSYAEMNVTIEGVGEDATVRGFGFLIRNAGSVEFKNFAIMLCLDDSLSFDTDNCNGWVHNMDFFYGSTGGDSDQAKGDGTIDVKGDSQYITFSYNHMWDNGKTSLCGMTSESGPNYITYHHNWFDHSDSRHPRIRTMSVHVMNNYYDGNAKYGVGLAKNSSAFVENNVFRNCKHPILSSKQGSDIMENADTGVPDFSAKGTFSGENGGVCKAYNNQVTGSDADKFNGGVEPVYYDAADTKTNGKSTQFDAYLAKTRDEEVPSSVKALVGGTSYDNAGLAVSKLCAPNPEPVETVQATVTKWAGRINNGDFKDDPNKYQISNDDSSYLVDAVLKAATAAYKSTLVSVGGGGTPRQDTPVTPTPTPTEKTTETTTQKPDDTTKPGETTTKRPTETTTETTTIQQAGEGKYDFGNVAFVKYEDRTAFGSGAGDSATINGMKIFYPASAVEKTYMDATDGASLSARIKFNAVPTLPEKESEMVNVIKIKVTKGETIKVYANASSNGKAPKVNFAANKKAGSVSTLADGEKEVLSSVAAGSSTKSVTPVQFKATVSGDIYIYLSENNGFIWKLQVLDAAGDDSSGTGTVSKGDGDVDGDGVLTVNDAMLIYDYAVNGSNSAVDEITIKNALGDVEVTKALAKEILNKVLSSK